MESLPYLESLLLGKIDAALAAQNAVVALESLGLGSVYIGGIRNYIEGVANELGLPPQVYPVFGLCVGYPSPDRPVKVKPRLVNAGQGNPDYFGIYIPEGKAVPVIRCLPWPMKTHRKHAFDVLLPGHPAQILV